MIDQNNLKKKVENAVIASTLTRFLANIYGFIAILTVLGIWAYQVVMGISVNSTIQMVLMGSLLVCLHILGINQGFSLQPPVVETKPEEDHTSQASK